MKPCDLITGFLGSGKTTFIRLYGQYLIRKGLHIGIIENDYGAVNVDMLLLQEALGDQADTEMVIAEDYDCHRRRFKAKLIAYGMQPVDRVVVEPSGIYDVDEFYDVLRDDPLERWYNVGSILAIVDAKLDQDLSRESEYLLVSQIANAGVVILSRSQEATEEEITETIAHMNRACEEFGCKRRFTLGDNVIAKNWDDFTDADFEYFESIGDADAVHIKLPVERVNDYSSQYFMNLVITPEEMKTAAGQVFADPDVGHVIRIKGFTKGEDGNWVELNATRRELTMRPSSVGQQVIIVIGEHLSKEALERHFESYIQV